MKKPYEVIMITMSEAKFNADRLLDMLRLLLNEILPENNQLQSIT